MKRYGHLFPDIVAFSNLLAASRLAMRGKRHNHRVAQFSFDLEPELLCLQAALLAGTWLPSDYRLFNVYEPKPRRIAAVDFKDRVVHHAIFRILEPLLDKAYHPSSFACRKGKGAHAALQKAHTLTHRYPYFLKLDIDHFFDSVDHQVLTRLLKRKIKDKNLLALFEKIITHAVPDLPFGKGMPIGNLSSQHFANLYLSPLDYFVRDTLACRAYVRYMDDFVLWAPDKPTLHVWKSRLEQFLAIHLCLKLKARATVLAPSQEGLPFLGFRLYPGVIRMQARTAKRTRRKLRQRSFELHKGHITPLQWQQSVSSLLGHCQQANCLSWRQQILYPVHRQQI